MSKIEQLRKCLQAKRKELNAKGFKYIPGESKLMDCKPFEIAYQDCIETLWPEEPWWKVTNYWDIFDAMMGGLSDEEVIDEICNNVSPEFLKEGFESAKVEDGHSYEEYMNKFGRAYNDGELWDFSEEDFKGGAIEVNPEITYWKIEVDGEPRYFETLGECKEACHKEKKSLDEGTSNFYASDYFPLLVFYTYDEVIDMMNYSSDPDKPEEADFEREDGEVDYEAYDEAREAWEERFWDSLDCAVLDEDEIERLEDKIYDFNAETQSIADRKYHDDLDDDTYYDLNNLEDIKVEVSSGYYEANYISVEHEKTFEYLSDAFKNEQLERFNKFFRELESEFGLTEYEVAWGPASNGETGYRKVKKQEEKLTVNDDIDENMYDGKKGGNKGSVKTKVHVNKNAGNPKRNMEIFNHMMGSDAPAVSTGVALGESEEGVARVEYCLMSDGDNVDCYGDEADAIANAKEFKDECAKRGMSNVVRVLLVKYGPKDEHGDEPELSAEEIWPDNPSFEDDDSRDERTNKEAAKAAKEESLKENIFTRGEGDVKEGDFIIFNTDDEDLDAWKDAHPSDHGYEVVKVDREEDGSLTGMYWIKDCPYALSHNEDRVEKIANESLKEEKECFFEIVFKEKGDEEEKTERYEDDFDGARADFLHMTQDERDNYQYVVLRKVCTDYNSEEEIEVIDSFGLEESLKEEKEELYDRVAKVLDDYGILYGDLVDNGDGTVNIVGVDEEEWDEVVEAIKAELGLDILVPDPDHGAFDDELIVRECLKEASSAEKKVYRNGGKDMNDYVQGKAIARIKDKDMRDAAVTLAKAGNSKGLQRIVGDRKEKQATDAIMKKQAAMQKAGLKEEESKLVRDIKNRIKSWLNSNGYEESDMELFVVEEKPYTDGEGNKATHIQIRNDLVGFYEADELISELDKIVDPGYFEPDYDTVWDAYIWEETEEDKAKRAELKAELDAWYDEHKGE